MSDAVVIGSLGRQARDPWFMIGVSIYLAFLAVALFADVIAQSAEGHPVPRRWAVGQRSKAQLGISAGNHDVRL